MTDKSQHDGPGGPAAGYKAALLAELQEDLERMQARQEQTRHIIDLLPDDLSATILRVGSWDTHCWVHMAVDDREELNDLIRVLPPEPMVLLRKGADFQDRELLLASDVERARREGELEGMVEVQPVAPYYWRHYFSTHGSRSDSSVHWTTRLRGDLLARVEVDIRKDPAHVIDGGEGPVDRRLRLEGAPQGEIMSSVRERPIDLLAHYTVYWPQRQGGSVLSDHSDLFVEQGDPKE